MKVDSLSVSPSHRGDNLFSPGHGDQGRGFVQICGPSRSASPTTSTAIRDAVLVEVGTQVDFALHRDLRRAPGELEHVEGEAAERSLSVFLHHHRLVIRTAIFDQVVSQSSSLVGCPAGVHHQGDQTIIQLVSL